MTEEQRRELERIKNTMGLTDKQAQDYLQGQNMTAEDLEALRQQVRQTMENPFNTWNTFNSSNVFGK